MQFLSTCLDCHATLSASTKRTKLNGTSFALRFQQFFLIDQQPLVNIISHEVDQIRFVGIFAIQFFICVQI